MNVMGLDDKKLTTASRTDLLQSFGVVAQDSRVATFAFKQG